MNFGKLGVGHKVGHFGLGEAAADKDGDFGSGGLAPSSEAGFALGPGAGTAASEDAVDLTEILEGLQAGEGIGQMFKGTVESDAAFRRGGEDGFERGYIDFI